MPSRRHVLRSAGASVVLPFLPSSGVATAGSSPSSARRLVAVGNLLGFQQGHLFPETGGMGYETTRLLKPLEGIRDQMTLYRGLDHGVKGGHFAVHSFLSGVLKMDAKGRPEGNISIDQLAAESIAGATRFPSLAVGSESGIHGGCQMCWTRSGTRVPPITGPRRLFDTLFLKDSKESLATRKDRFALQGSILDTVRGDAKSLHGRLDWEDREKLDEYLTSVREVEQKLHLQEQWADVEKPRAPFEAPNDRNLVEDLPLLYELIALALQTDSTRIATLEIGGDFLPKDLGISDGYHALSHHGKREEKIQKLLLIEEHQLKHFGRFVDRLRGMEVDGGSLLDQTSVLFGSGMGNANVHSNSDLPIIVAGGGSQHGAFKMVTGKRGERRRLCNLYVSLLQSFGLEVEQFGNSDGTLV